MRTALLAAALACGLASSSSARPLEMPSEPEAPPAAAPAADGAPAERSGTPSRIHHFVLDPGLARLDGEVADIEWPIYITNVEAVRPSTVYIAYTNAVSVAPETSSLKVEVNDVPLAAIPIVGADQLSAVAVDLPNEILQPGHNAIRLSVSQRHRVDCGVPATNELWTRIEPSMTGLVYGGGPMPFYGLDDLRAIDARDTGAVRIRAWIPPGASAERIGRVLRAAQLAVLRGNYLHPVVEVVPELERLADAAPSDLNLLVGTIGELSAVPWMHDAKSTLFLRPGDGASPATLVATGTTEVSVAESVDRILTVDQRPVGGTVPGLRALRTVNGVPADAGSRLSFADLGVRSQEFSGRNFRARFDIRLPRDLYAKDDTSAILNLNAAYGLGLTESAQLRVVVNGTVSAAVHLAAAQGQMLRQQIRLPMRDFRPGVNSVAVEVDLPSREDESCAAGVSGGAGPRFILFDDSDLSIPRIARIGRLPELASLTAGAFPYADSGGPTDLYIPRIDRHSLGAAATLLARLASAAGEPLPVVVTSSEPSMSSRNRITVGSLRDLPAGVLQQAGVDVVATRVAWSHLAAGRSLRPEPGAGDKDRTLAQMLTGRAPDRAPDQTSAAAPEAVHMLPRRTDNQDLYNLWRESVATEGSSRDVWATGQKWLNEQLGLKLDMLRLVSDAEKPIVPSPMSTVLLAQSASDNSTSATWTLLTAPAPELLESGAQSLTARSVWKRLAGRASTYDPASDIVETFAATKFQYRPTQPLDIANWRLVVANWSSLNILYYGAAVLIACIALGITTDRLVRKLGVKQS